jgi:hypothetical protein
MADPAGRPEGIETKLAATPASTRSGPRSVAFAARDPSRDPPFAPPAPVGPHPLADEAADRTDRTGRTGRSRENRSACAGGRAGRLPAPDRPLPGQARSGAGRVGGSVDRRRLRRGGPARGGSDRAHGADDRPGDHGPHNNQPESAGDSGTLGASGDQVSQGTTHPEGDQEAEEDPASSVGGGSASPDEPAAAAPDQPTQPTAHQAADPHPKLTAELLAVASAHHHSARARRLSLHRSLAPSSRHLPGRPPRVGYPRPPARYRRMRLA